jgi:hypothetical protein
MERVRKKGRRGVAFLAVFASSLFMMALVGVFFSAPIQSWWKTFTKESMRILGREQASVSPEEKRIREEVILKKMEEASLTGIETSGTRVSSTEPDGRRCGKGSDSGPQETPEFKEMDRI